MSEVKPTLVSSISESETVLHSWKNAFPSNKWIDAGIRKWYWIDNNISTLPKAYEYRIEFDVFTDDFTVVFPYVVRTSSRKIKKSFINGVEYRVRSRENFGNRFVVSGTNFKFKLATRYKLGRRVFPIITFYFWHSVFNNRNFVFCDYNRIRNTFSPFKTIEKFDTNYVFVRNVFSDFKSPLLMYCDYRKTSNLPSAFININRFHAPCIANCKSTTWDRFGGIWIACETWIPSANRVSFSSLFTNINIFTAGQIIIERNLITICENINSLNCLYNLERRYSPVFKAVHNIEANYLVAKQNHAIFTVIGKADVDYVRVKTNFSTFKTVNETNINFVLVKTASPVFKTVNKVYADYVLGKTASPVFKLVGKMDADYTLIKTNSAVLNSKESLFGNYYVIHNLFSEFTNKNIFTTSYAVNRNNNAIFKNINTIYCDIYVSSVRIITFESTFINVNRFDVNGFFIRNVSTDFKTKMFISVDYYKLLNLSAPLNSVNIFDVGCLANYGDTSWDRFGGIWNSWDTWAP